MGGGTNGEMKTATVLTIVFGVLLSNGASAQDARGSVIPLPIEITGRYSCLTSDKTELSISNRSSGHKYQDLDGDTSDPNLSVTMEIGSDQMMKLQSVFAGEAGALEQYRILTNFQNDTGDTDRKSYQLVAISTGGNSWVPRKVVQVTVNGRHQTVGLMTSTLSSGKPAMLDGEKIVMSDIEIMLCTKAR